MLDYISRMGITAVELLPIHTFVNDSYLSDKGLTNYWGYNTIGFFAPTRRYAYVPDFAFSEFKEMVARFHAAGIEVILDVVYNHTAEGNELGPTLSFKGIDNASYYRLLPDQNALLYQRHRHRQHLQSLASSAFCKWSQTSCAIGCRRCMSTVFVSILATILAREAHGFDEGGGFLDRAVRIPCCPRSSLSRSPGTADRGLSGRWLFAGMGRMERSLPRCGAIILERRRGQGR